MIEQDADIARARAALGAAAPAADAPRQELARALVGRLGEDAAAAEAAHRRELEDLERRAATRLAAMHDVQTAVGTLHGMTAPSEMLGAAPAALGTATGLGRVLLSSVHDGVMTVEAAWVRDDARTGDALLKALREQPTRLTPPLAETEVTRRRLAMLVTPDETRPAAGLPGREARVIAPVVVRSTTIVLLHADRDGGANADDRDLLAAFAEGLAQAYEIAVLRRALRRERAEMRSLLEWLDARSRELSDAAHDLDLPPAVAPPAAPLPSPLPGAVDTVIFDGVLTRRELEVLRHLVEGLSNGAIADELVISVGTVKFHVNRILTRLHVANRAEAVARYYALVGTRPET